MNEDLQIEKGARLSDVKAPEDLATDRARKFISRNLEKNERAKRRSYFAWGGFSIAFAACVALAVVFLGHRPDEVSYEVKQQESIHAAAASVDSAAKAQADSLKTDFELPVE